jgi:hypothetical protein
MLAAGWVRLALGGTQEPMSASRIAQWRVIAGADVGAWVTADAFSAPAAIPLFGSLLSDNPLRDSPGGTVELCRPASFSPLR